MSADQRNTAVAGMPTGQEAREQVRDSLVSNLEQQLAGTPTPAGRDLGDCTWSRVRRNIVLAPAGT